MIGLESAVELCVRDFPLPSLSSGIQMGITSLAQTEEFTLVVALLLQGAVVFLAERAFEENVGSTVLDAVDDEALVAHPGEGSVLILVQLLLANRALEGAAWRALWFSGRLDFHHHNRRCGGSQEDLVNAALATVAFMFMVCVVSAVFGFPKHAGA
jgi:hypothetical protein